MADKSIGELVAANQVLPNDMFVLEQDGTAKKLTGQVLENWLLSFAGGHGGIQNIEKVSTEGLVDTYRITLSDTSTFDFPVSNGKGIVSITKSGTSGLVDTYTISYNDQSTATITITNGAKGDKGDNWYVWIKYASQKPTEESHSIGDIPDNWIGFYSGTQSEAPSDWQAYTWFEIKGAKGDTGAPATLSEAKIEYQVGTSGTVTPSGEWQSSVPTTAQGQYLWTRITVSFNSGSPIIFYSVTRMGIDGKGAVATINGISPDSEGNVKLSAIDVDAVGSVEGVLPDETGNVSLPKDNTPTLDSTKLLTSGVVAQAFKDAQPIITSVVLPVASWVGNDPYTQVVDIEPITAYSQININATAELLKNALDQGFSLVFGNNNGTVTVYAVGAKPSTELNVPVTILEVRNNA